MITREPFIKVGILDHAKEVLGDFKGAFRTASGLPIEGQIVARLEGKQVVVADHAGTVHASGSKLQFDPTNGSKFALMGVVIGIQFHWERKEDQTFEGALTLVARNDGTLAAINEVPVEKYLESVISSEMSAEAPIELLKAHAITSRSWLVAMLEREERNIGVPSLRTIEHEGELIRWYDREDHDIFDVCADDHCQRYQGVTKIISESAAKAVQDTRGVFLVYDGSICDARFSKSCGGLSEEFENAWEETRVPYLTCVSDAAVQHPVPHSEEAASQWILSSPEAYCNTTDGKILRQILPSFDQETTDFFRWKVEYTRAGLSELLAKKSGFDFGEVKALVPLQRGPSGRIVKLSIEGTKKTLVVGKELEIRRWLSRSHLYSSAFVVRPEPPGNDVPQKFTLSGAGWGHGVGLCQIGAAVMATRGFKAEEIVKHYFRGSELRRLY